MPHDDICVVSGATRGLGRALVLELVARGQTVAALGRDGAALEQLVSQAPSQIHPVTVDMGDGAAVTAAFERLSAQVGMAMTLINNAAVYPRRDILDETAESFRDTVGINLGGTVAASLAVLPQMVARGQGRIVNVMSFADVRPAPMSAAYSVTKGAIRIFTRALVADLGDRFPDIVITDWAPGVLNTQMGLSEGLAPETAAAWGATLALRTDRALNGMVFAEDREHRAPLSLKGRLKAKLTGKSAPLVRLS